LPDAHEFFDIVRGVAHALRFELLTEQLSEQQA
jgi:hypothetical protein